MEIPTAVRGYAEVVVDAAGVAHRPASYRYVSGSYTRRIWEGATPTSGGFREQTDPIYDLGWYPKCQAEPASETRPTVRQYSAGWAHHLGHPGCPDCWPSATTDTTNN